MQHNPKSAARRLTVLVPALLVALLAVSVPALSATHSADTGRTSLAGDPGHKNDHEEFNTKA
ncbi:hypothetical protein AB0M57_33255 [Streptomyces sp. NPDC051597]|uniref:hypothetical protein n=1 Tax=Streptomyces sp. NPDC051597 TaxID=3155049 RepID=UPI0034133B45